MSSSQCCENPPTLRAQAVVQGMRRKLDPSSPMFLDPPTPRMMSLSPTFLDMELQSLAKIVVELAKYPYIQAAVLLHPALVSVDDIQVVKVPISVLGAETDSVAPPELLKHFDVALNTKPEVDGFVKIFRGVEHGWTVRYKDEDEVAVKPLHVRICWTSLSSMYKREREREMYEYQHL